jgi:PhnB protein
MAQINPYLNFPGNTEEAFNFYKSIFGGDFLTVTRFKDTAHGADMPADYQDKLMHIALPIGNNILMGTDAIVPPGQTFKFGDNMSIAINAESVDQANQLFEGLSADGKVELPIQKMFWGAWFGMATDKFGTQWMVSYDENQPK